MLKPLCGLKLLGGMIFPASATNLWKRAKR